MVRTPQKAVVKVYGTQFNVEAYADDKTITATLVEGSIATVSYTHLDVYKRQG